MKAAIFVEPKRIEIDDITKPEPAEDEVRIKLNGCGLCGSNLPVWEGREWFQYPFTAGAPGHEGWGTIDAVGKNVCDFKEGDSVTALTYNAFADYDIAKENLIVKLPSSFDDKPFPGEPLGCAMNVFKRADIKEGQTVAIIGIGFIGALLTAFAKNSGAKVIAISRRETSLDTASNYNADHLIKMDDHWRIIDEVKKITNDNLCDRVIEAVGMQWPLDLAGELTKERGKLIVAGYHQDGVRQVNMQLWNWRGIDVINAHERDPNIYIQGIKDAVHAVEKNIFNPQQLFTHEFPVEKINTAFQTAELRPSGFMKALIRFN